mgnify:CR=1
MYLISSLGTALRHTGYTNNGSETDAVDRDAKLYQKSDRADLGISPSRKVLMISYRIMQERPLFSRI